MTAILEGNGTGTPMPRYKCHKEVHAVKLGAIEVNKDGTATLVPTDGQNIGPFKVDQDWTERFKKASKDNYDDAGYFVVYEGGYASWSPTEAFEKGYTLIET